MDHGSGVEILCLVLDHKDCFLNVFSLYVLYPHCVVISLRQVKEVVLSGAGSTLSPCSPAECVPPAHLQRTGSLEHLDCAKLAPNTFRPFSTAFFDERD